MTPPGSQADMRSDIAIRELACATNAGCQFSEQLAEFMLHVAARVPGDRGVPMTGVLMSVAVVIDVHAPVAAAEGAAWLWISAKEKLA